MQTIEEDGGAALERLERLTLLETYEEAYNRALSLQESEVCGDGKAQSRLRSRVWEAWGGYISFQVVPSSPDSKRSGPEESAGETQFVEEDAEFRRVGWKRVVETEWIAPQLEPWDAMIISKKKAESPKTSKILEGSSSPLDRGDIDDDFRSVSSYISKSTFHTAVSRLDGKSSYKLDARLHRDSDYAQALAKKNLWPVDPSVEQDWSGRGQHTDFQKEERNLINQILEFQEPLGKGSYAAVDSVKCRRILLARKTIFCRRPLTRNKAIDEVAHLTRLRHSHIVRLIGTYTVSKELSILMYPVADYNLDEFISQLFEEQQQDLRSLMITSIPKFFGCLVSAIYAIHMRLIKHMDIKPQNILVRKQMDRLSPTPAENFTYHIYVTDFGISRSYERLEDANTDGPTSYTRKYAAPEVIQEDTRGFPADIFSLGCVFLEIAACIYDSRPEGSTETSVQKHLRGLLEASTPRQPWYYANINRIDQYLGSSEWPGSLEKSVLPPDTFTLIRSMIANDPKARPEAEKLCTHFTPRACCLREPLPFEVTK